MKKHPSKALLLAAGKGTRLGPIGELLSKCIVPIAGKPLLEYWIRLLQAGGIREIWINLHYKSALVKQYLDTLKLNNVTIHYIEEETLRGTLGTVKHFANHVVLEPDESVFVAHADNLSFFDFTDFSAAHQNRQVGCDLTMMLFEAPNPQLCGVVELNDERVVTAFFEKAANPPSALANGAVFFFASEVFAQLKKLTLNPVSEISLELIPRYLGRIQSYQNQVYHRDIGTPLSFMAAQKEIKSIDYEKFLKPRHPSFGTAWDLVFNESLKKECRDLFPELF